LNRIVPFALLAAALACGGATAQQAPAGEWPVYGGDPGGSRYSPLATITRENVAQLEAVWTFHTGETGPAPDRGGPPALEATPIVVDGTMYVSTPYGRVFALDPVTGTERWRFDPLVNGLAGYGDFTNRGVSTWLDSSAAPGAACRRRVLVATIDARLMALDAALGRPCEGFGTGGTVDLRQGLRTPPFEFPAYEQTSPPAVVNDVIVVGSAIADNSRANPASGEVRGFDARTGALKWSWDPIPQDPADPASATWAPGTAAQTGAANAWTILTADPARDLVFVPTSSAAPDYFGGRRPGENRYANSIVALRASTGRVVWQFQTVHHDLWDYDNAAPAALTTVRRDGQELPAVLQATKTGMLFMLHRETGEPLFAVEERRVPASDVPDESAWPTQPFTAVTPPLVPHRLADDDLWGASPEALAACREALRGLRNEGIFTPPSRRGTLARPSNIGGAHWGGVAADSASGIAVVPVNNIAAIVQLIPAQGFDRRTYDSEAPRYDWQFTTMQPTPYVMRRRLFLGADGLPCTRPPFGSLVAVSLSTGGILWNVPLGDLRLPGGEGPATGSPNLGGPIVTAGGLVFMAGTLDRGLRAFDIETGRELWHTTLPAGARATPMTYQAGGRQFVVVAAGGGGRFGDGDAIVAFSLPVAR
jgi:quinoprotein glucose dehydrogenase